MGNKIEANKCRLDGKSNAGGVIRFRRTVNPGVEVVLSTDKQSGNHNELLPCVLENQNLIDFMRRGQKILCGKCGRGFSCLGYEKASDKTKGDN